MIRWLMKVEQLVERELAGKTEVFEEHPPQVQFIHREFFPFGARARIWALAYLHENSHFISVYYILDIW
jgi:hypothetical protein